MKLTIIALFAFLAITSGLNLKKLNPILAQVNEHPFGKATTALIQMTVNLSQEEDATTGELNEIMELLNGLKQDNIDETEAAAEFMAEQRPIFRNQIRELTDQLTNLNTKLDNYKVEKEILTKEGIEKRRELEETTEDVADWESELVVAEQELEAENIAFEIRDNELSTMIIAIEEGIRVLNQMVHGTLHDSQKQYYGGFSQIKNEGGFSLVELQNSFMELKPKFEDMFNNFKEKADRHSLIQLSPVLSIFATLSNAAENNLNMDRYMEIIDLLVSLLDGLNKTQQELRTEHAATVLRLETLIENLTNWIAQGKIRITQLENRLIEIKIRLNELGQLIPECEEDIRVTAIALQDTKDDFQELEDTYASEQAHRDAELEILERLIKYFQTEVALSVEDIDDEVHNDELTE